MTLGRREGGLGGGDLHGKAAIQREGRLLVGLGWRWTGGGIKEGTDDEHLVT